MPTIAVHAAKDPDRIALIYGNGERTQSFGELELRSRRIGHLLRRRGLAQGGCVAALIDNADPAFMEVYWACHRVGLYFTPVNWHLQEDEIQYIVDNCDAKAFIAHVRFAEVAQAVAAASPKLVAKVSEHTKGRDFVVEAKKVLRDLGACALPQD